VEALFPGAFPLFTPLFDLLFFKPSGVNPHHGGFATNMERLGRMAA
jgi:hypothetical protein